MKIVTFYSYKGGTGRSLTLANVACALAVLLKQKVGIVDLDVEAAALHELFRVTPGTANLLTLLQPSNRSIHNVEQHIVSVPLNSNTGGQLYLLPSVTDSKLIDDIRWDAGVESFLADDAFPVFNRMYNLDYLLIDARAGVSSFANFSLRISHLVVVIGRADRQHLSGLKKIFTVCRVAGKPFKFVLNACPSPNRNHGKLSRFFRELEQDPDFIIPYEDELYFKEKIAIREQPTGSLARKYSEIGREIHQHLSGTP